MTKHKSKFTLTYKDIVERCPCSPSFYKLTNFYAPKSIYDTVTIKQIYECNGLHDAIWALCTLEYKHVGPFVIEMLHAFCSFIEDKDLRVACINYLSNYTLPLENNKDLMFTKIAKVRYTYNLSPLEVIKTSLDILDIMYFEDNVAVECDNRPHIILHTCLCSSIWLDKIRERPQFRLALTKIFVKHFCEN